MEAQLRQNKRRIRHLKKLQKIIEVLEDGAEYTISIEDLEYEEYLKLPVETKIKMLGESQRTRGALEDARKILGCQRDELMNALNNELRKAGLGTISSR